jgi:molecular chaperone DnaJ
VATDYYEVLGIARGSSEDDIKRAYRQLARRHHPDVSQDKTAAEARFKEINEAYSVLSDPNRRQMYDQFGHAGVNGQGAQSGFGSPFAGFGGDGIGDIFEMFFGPRGGAQQRASAPQRGSDLRYDLQITLEDAYRGTERTIAFTHLGGCETCKGTGAEPGTLVTPCDQCRGSGVVRMTRQTPLGAFTTQGACPKCHGEGQIIASPCAACHGQGRVEQRRSLTVKVPAGVDDGSRIRLEGHGEGGERGGPSGDLYVYLTVARHQRFRRDGLDLLVDVPISFAVAALGGAISIETFDGPVELQVPAGTQTGSVHTLRGHGMPAVRRSARGNMRVRTHVDVPRNLTRRQRDLLEEYADIGGDKVDERSFFERFKDAFKAD